MTIIEQYHAAKRTHPNMLLLFRVGDEYQLFDEDAKTVGTLLGLTITTSVNIAMTTFPHVSLEAHLRTLLQAGHRVAILDQVP
jgi:DNA mismatch repair protein MutS